MVTFILVWRGLRILPNCFVTIIAANKSKPKSRSGCHNQNSENAFLSENMFLLIPHFSQEKCLNGAIFGLGPWVLKTEL